MVSLDEPEKNRAFAESLGAKHVVLSDPEQVAAKQYGVVTLGGFYSRRWTFYVDAGGMVRYVDKDVHVTTAGQDIVRRLEALGFPKTD
jgi:peroxiredoxin